MRALALDLDTLARVCRRQAVCLLVAFGSAVRDLRRPESDLDLAVWMATANIAPQAPVRLEVALRPLFPGEHLDLVLLNRASPLLQFQVALRGAVLFEAAPGVFHAFQVLASKRHADVAHLRRLDRMCVERFLRRQPPMIDRELVNRKLSQIVEYLTALTPLQALSYADYMQQPLSRYAAERLLQLIVDTAVDINAHLIVELTSTPPQDDYDSFIKAVQEECSPWTLH
jgi:predicted nucleotidyltransferase